MKTRSTEYTCEEYLFHDSESLLSDIEYQMDYRLWRSSHFSLLFVLKMSDKNN